MPIEIVFASARPAGLVQFNFANPVMQYTIGIRAFTMTYGADDHWIKSLGIRILPVQNSAVGAASNQVSAHVDMTMQDCSGNNIKVASSAIWPVCIAVTGSDERNTVFGSAMGVSAGDQGQIVPMPPGNGSSIQTCFLSGFNFTFATDHQILQSNAMLGFPPPRIAASAGMNDSKGNSLLVATLDSGYIASTYPTPGMVATEVSVQTMAKVEVPLPGAKTAVALIRGWTVEFPHVHNVQTIEVGAWGDPTCANDVVTIPKGCYAHMNDTSGNSQDDSISFCDVVVIATT